MVSGKDWEDSFNSPENKKKFIKLLPFYFPTDEGRDSFEIPMIINNNESEWGITKKGLKTSQCQNHEEIDEILIFHTTIRNEAAAVVSKDVGLLLLLVYDLGQLEYAFLTMAYEHWFWWIH